MASVQMTHEFASKAATPVKTASAEMPCHQHQQAASVSADPSAAALVSPPKSKHPVAPDCCKSSACRCACMHSAPATVAMMIFTPALVEHSQSVRPMALGHAAPALPHLIRPPIG
ncbi:CopL family metal-binding regulatory protein [Xanthomonas hortorum]